MMTRYFLWRVAFGLLLLVSSLSCTPLSGTFDNQVASHFQAEQIYDLNRRQLVTFDELMTALRGVEVLYFGEAHYTPPHIQAALRVLKQLRRDGRSLVLAMEMFSWDGQPGLDRYIRHDITEQEEFLKASLWKKNWGDRYEVYQPLVAFAYEHQIPLRALNPPLSLVRQVSKTGLANISENPEVQRWNMDEPFPVEDPDYYRILFEQITECHPGLKQEVYQKIYEASIFRDEGMSKVIAEALKGQEDVSRMIVSYTGAGHIQYGEPIPKRVARRRGQPVHQVTIYLVPFDPVRPADIQEMMDERVADYLWLTPLGPNGPQSRCGS